MTTIVATPVLTSQEVAEIQAQAGPEIQMTEAQKTIFRMEVEKRARRGDEALVKYCEKYSEFLTLEDFADLAEQAAQAHDRLEVAKAEAESQQKLAQAETKAQPAVVKPEPAKEEKPREQIDREKRAKIARIFEQRGWSAASAAIETELDGLNAIELKTINVALREAIEKEAIGRGDNKPAEPNLKWTWNPLKDHCNKAFHMMNALNQQWVLENWERYLRNIEAAECALEEIATAKWRGLHDKILENAERALSRAKRIWAYQNEDGTFEKVPPYKALTLCYLARQDRNVVCQTLAENKSVAMAFDAADDNYSKGMAILTAIEKPARDQILAMNAKIASRKETPEEKAKKMAKYAERAHRDTEYRNSMKGHNPGADSFKTKKK